MKAETYILDGNEMLLLLLLPLEAIRPNAQTSEGSIVF